jgi:hypothetical protein
VWIGRKNHKGVDKIALPAVCGLITLIPAAASVCRARGADAAPAVVYLNAFLGTPTTEGIGHAWYRAVIAPL